MPDPIKISALGAVTPAAEDSIPILDNSGATTADKNKRVLFSALRTWLADGWSYLTNPMTTAGDLIVGGTSGTPERLAKGANGKVLGVASGAVGWVDPSGGMSNPMTTAQDLIVGGASGTPGRLAVGTNGKVLGVASGAVGWVDPSGGMSNPMTTAQDLIVGGASGTPGRLAVGANGKVLGVSGGAVGWVDPSGGSSLPVTDTTALVSDPSDATKRVRLDAGQVASGQTRAIQAPNGDCRVRASFYVPLKGSTSDLVLGEVYHVAVMPGLFMVDRTMVACMDVTGILEHPEITIKKNGSSQFSVSLSVVNEGAGRYGESAIAFSVALGDVITAVVTLSGAGSAGSPAKGLQIHLSGYWPAL
jgi:hypothetical protein